MEDRPGAVRRRLSPPAVARNPARVPVLVGVGEVNDRPARDADGLDSAELMAAALARADADGGGGWLGRCERLLIVPQISFRDLDVPHALARLTGVAKGRIAQAPLASGDTPVRLLHDAADTIAAGEASVVAIAGGEALRTAARRAAASGADPGLFTRSREAAPPLRHRYGLVTPAEIYPLYENALRAELGQSFAEAQAETGRIWSLLSEVASTAEGAWLRERRSAAEIVTPGPDNRPIAWPYTKLTVANASVNQGAAAVVASLAAARAAGVPERRLVHIGAGAAAHEADEPLARANFTTPPAMRVTIERTMALNGLAAADLDLVELYSCFPCVPKMARRVLDWPAERPVTVHGGLTFGGGPIANYMTHAIAATVRRLRDGGARRGLLYANGGHCSHNHALVLLADQPAEPPPPGYDYQAEADGLRGAIPPLTDEREGVFPVETFTVIHDRSGRPAYGVVLSRADTGERVIARVPPEDARTLALLTDPAVEPVGRPGRTARVGDRLHWSAA